MSDRHPIDYATLADYWLGALAGADEQEVELHLLDCDACGDRLREMIGLAEGIRRIAREGALRVVIGEGFLRRAADAGLRLRQYDVPAGGTVHCTVLEDDDIMVARLGADLRGAERVDLSICDQHGVEMTRLRDIPVAAGAGAVTVQEGIAFLKAAPTFSMLMRLVSVDAAGGERMLGEYTFHHTRSLPGPPGW